MVAFASLLRLAMKTCAGVNVFRFDHLLVVAHLEKGRQVWTFHLAEHEGLCKSLDSISAVYTIRRRSYITNHVSEQC